MLFQILISNGSLRGGALLVLLSQFVLCHAQEPWVWQNRLPQGNTLVGICVVNEAQMMAVGEAATFMKTKDAGATWEIVHSAGGLVGTMRDVYFVDDNTGWAVGSSGRILNTIDGGQIWSVTETQISFTLVWRRFCESRHRLGLRQRRRHFQDDRRRRQLDQNANIDECLPFVAILSC